MKSKDVISIDHSEGVRSWGFPEDVENQNDEEFERA